MKTKFLLLLLIPCFCFPQTQAQNKECVRMAAQIDSLVKADDYENAYQQWTSSAKCVSETIYINGEKILLHKLAAPATEAEKQDYLASLLKVYEGDDKNFPGNKNGNLVKRAMVLDTYKTGTPEEIYALLDRAFKTDPDNFTDAKALYLYFDLFFSQFKAGNKGIAEDDVFAKQDAVSIRLQQLSEQSTSGKRDYKTVSDGIRALTSSITSCDKLDAYYQKNFEAKKADTLWLQRASETLILGNCTKTTLFLTIASEWYKLEPNSKSAYNLGKASMRHKNQADAVKYFNISADMEPDPGQKANTYYTIAMLLSGDRPQSLDYLKKALAAKPTFGKAYLLMAELYSSMDCGETTFDKKAIYFLAAKTARKAGEVDSSMKKPAESQAAAFLKKAPSADEIKEAKKGGKTVAFACGINESVVIPE